MAHVIAGRARESFEHSIIGQFDVTATREVAKAHGKFIIVPFSDFLDYCRENHVWEPERVAALDTISWRHDPGIMLWDTTNGQVEHTMIDGIHRALRREREGLTEMVFWELPVAQAIRPGFGWGMKPGYDWGDAVVDGKIVRRT